MSSLIKYDAARYALEQAVSVDEAKDIRDKAQAMAAYAKQAKDTKLVEWATEIKVRAERKAGQMLAELNLKPGPKTISSSVLPIDISKTQSSRWQKLASVPDDQFEQAVTAAKEVAGEVTTAAMLRIERSQNPKPPKPPKTFQSTPAKSSDEDSCDPLTNELQEALDTIEELAEQNTALRDSIALERLPEAEISDAYETITELRAQVKTLEASLRAITSMRDSLMRENAEMKKQLLSQRNQIKKLGGK
jgi:hypothetical protein